VTFDIRLRAYDPGTDTALGWLPEPLSIEASFVHNNDGALTVKYSSLADGGALAARSLNDGLDVAVEIDTGSGYAEVINGRFLLIDRDIDITDPMKLVTLTFVSWSWLLNKICDLNLSVLLGKKTKHPGQRKFSSQDVGSIVKTLLDEHDARSGPAVPILRDSWNGTVDSGGNAWAKKRTRYYDPGQPLHDRLDALVADGLCDWRTVGRGLRIYNQNSASWDYADSVVLSYGSDLQDAPSAESQSSRVARLLVKGDGKHRETVKDPTIPEHYGRWEAMLDVAGVDDDAELDEAGDAELDTRNRIRAEFTRTLTLAGPFLPFRDYNIGDWITAPSSSTNERLRVMQITINIDENGLIGGNVVLGDRFTNKDLALAGKVQAITGGSSGATGNGKTTTTPPQDERQPAAPTNLHLVSEDLEWNGQVFGAWEAHVNLAWDAVTTATDATELEIKRYEVLGQPQTTPASTWRTLAYTADSNPEIDLFRFAPGSSWLFTVRAYGITTTEEGVQSATLSHTFLTDGTPPNQPSTPTVSNYLGVLIGEWDGLDSTAGAMPVDFARCDVHMSTTSGFTPDASTFNQSLAGAGVWTIANLPYDTPQYFKLIAYDTNGNASTPSAQATGTPLAVVTDDMAQDAIDSIVNDAVTATLTSPNGLNTTVYSANDPEVISGYTPKDGDTWRKTSGSPVTIIGEWHYNGTSWDEQTLSHETISSIDAGAITVGYLNADRIAANSLAASKLFIGDYTNMWHDGFDNPDMVGNWGIWTPVTEGAVTVGVSKAGTGAQNGQYYSGLDFPVEGGASYYFQALRTDLVGSTGRASMYVQQYDASDTYISTLKCIALDAAGTSGGSITTSSNCAYVRPGFYTESDMSSGTTVEISNVYIRRKNEGSLIVDGAITAGSAIIANGAIGYAQIGSVNASTISTGTLSADRIAVSTLTGKTLTSGTVSGGTVTGATVQTASSGQRIVLTTSGMIYLYGPGGSPTSYIAQSASGAMYINAGGTSQIYMVSSGGFKISNMTPATSSANAYLWDDSAGFRKLMVTTSLRQYKKQIRDLAMDATQILGLRPRQWFDLHDMQEHGLDPDTATVEDCLAAGLPWTPGFVAEEVEATAPLFVTRTPTGELQGVQYDRLVAGLLRVVQEQDRTIQDHEARLASIEAQLLEIQNERQ